MPRLIVLLQEGYFKTYECKEEFELSFLKEIINGWPECAIRSPDLNFIGFKTKFEAQTSVDAWCDSDGYSKGLPFTLLRQSDDHPLVGPLVLCCRREFYDAEGADFRLQPFDDDTTQGLIYYLRASDWIEVVYNEGIAITNTGEALN
tara:strand:- start:1054 stop:1494 length:441 start_codon:yes stop_codon:yes gene_type:complete